MARASRPGAGRRAARSRRAPAPVPSPSGRFARDGLPAWVRKPIGADDDPAWPYDVGTLAPLLNSSPASIAAWNEYASALGLRSGVEPTRLHVTTLLAAVLSALDDFERWLRPPKGKRGPTRQAKARAIARAALKLRELIPQYVFGADPDWELTGRRAIEKHYRECLDTCGVPTGFFERNAVSPASVAWYLTTVLPVTLEAVEDGARAWGCRKPLAPHARDETAPRTYFLRRMAAYFERNTGSKRPKLSAMLGNLFFPELPEIGAKEVSRLIAGSSDVNG